MGDYDGYEDEPPEDEPVRETVKESLMPKVSYDMPIPERFCTTTKAMFYEYRFQTTVTDKAPYTLGKQDRLDKDGKHLYKSMYLIYMQCDSEYEAAIKLLGSYPHWRKLKRCSWFHDHFEEWEEERNIRDEAIARSILVRLAMVGNVTAARTLYTNSNAKPKGKLGRPETGGQRQVKTGDDELDEMLSRSFKAGED